MRKKLIFCCLTGMFVFLISGCAKQEDAYLETYQETEETEQETYQETGQIQTEDLESEIEVQTYYIYVCGAVVNPGVYSLPAGSRIFEAIEMAGGLTMDADTHSINQALEVTDGMMLLVYTKEETSENHLVMNPDGTKQSVADERVDINKAGVSELMQLPGIGRTKAEAIVNYRTVCGAFMDIEDLMNIPGIKEGIFEQIKEQIKVDE